MPDTSVKSLEEKFIPEYWSYYLELEDQLLSMKRYVHFDINNYKTYSLEFLKLFQAVCSEIDTFAKELAKQHGDQVKGVEKANIQKWSYLVSMTYPDVFMSKVIIGTIRTEPLETMAPWYDLRTKRVQSKDKNGRESVGYNFDGNGNPVKWWVDYNKVKHQRTVRDEGVSNFTKANLGNTIHALAGLYVLESRLSLTLGVSSQTESRLFKVKDSRLS